MRPWACVIAVLTALAGCALAEVQQPGEPSTAATETSSLPPDLPSDLPPVNSRCAAAAAAAAAARRHLPPSPTRRAAPRPALQQNVTACFPKHAGGRTSIQFRVCGRLITQGVASHTSTPTAASGFGEHSWSQQQQQQRQQQQPGRHRRRCCCLPSPLPELLPPPLLLTFAAAVRCMNWPLVPPQRMQD